MTNDIVTKFNCMVNLFKPCLAFIYGSHIYKTNNQDSDIDCVFVIDDDSFQSHEKTLQDFDIHFYSLKDFTQNKIEPHDIQFLEGLSIRDSEFFYIDEKYQYIIDNFKKDLTSMRHSISSICSNSFVKSKKKILVEEDYDRDVSKKSLFHCIRMYDFGKQFAEHDRIVDFTSCASIYEMIDYDYRNLPDDELVDIINTKYKKIFNSYASSFKKLCPKK